MAVGSGDTLDFNIGYTPNRGQPYWYISNGRDSSPCDYNAHADNTSVRQLPGNPSWSKRRGNRLCQFCANFSFVFL